MVRKSTIERFNNSLIKEEEKKILPSLKWKYIYYIWDEPNFSLFEWMIMENNEWTDWLILVDVTYRDRNNPFKWEQRIDINRLKFKK